MTIRSRKSLIMDLIGPELSYLPLNLKISIFDFAYTLASTNIDQSYTKLGQNVYDHKISGEFDYRSNRTRTV